MGFKKNFIIHCPGNAQAGGIESLHQLGDQINSLGGKALMCYYPHEEVFTKPKKFEKYQVESTVFCDSKEHVHIFPEIFTKLSLKVKEGLVCIFWLSIDNYYFRKDHFSFFKRQKKYFGSLLTARLPISFMTKYIHLYQSEYSRIHFEKRKFNQFELGDYIYYKQTNLKRPEERIKRVLYNPSKGLHVTRKLIEKNSDIEFLPLEGYSQRELAKLMQDSLVYIDFGMHPGRDRLPREAVLQGCVIISGQRGSAGNNKDIPLPTKYKFDTEDNNFFNNFRKLIDSIFSSPSNHFENMLVYRNVVLEDPNRFRDKVEFFLKKVSSDYKST